MNAVKYLFDDKSDKILNFSGGTHHGRSSFASGFCFLNDCILSIIKAINLGFKKILYIDIDAHHCDAVQDYFIDHDNVFIISVHERNRWPKTGFISDCSHKNILNIPVSYYYLVPYHRPSSFSFEFEEVEIGKKQQEKRGNH